MTRGSKLAVGLMLSACAAGLCAQTTTVRGRVEVAAEAPQNENTQIENKAAGKATAGEGKGHHGSIPATVVWLTPAPSSGVELDPPKPNVGGNARLVQKNKSFEPRILVVPAGSMVEFPNRDPFFHNVFSLFEGKRFDLGLYEASTSRMVRFDRPGISYIFCNIHPDMSAVVITIATPFYAISTRDGLLSLAGVPYGRYILHIWSEGMGPENAQPLTHEIKIGENTLSLGVIRVPAANGEHIAHKNKYGRDYDEPTPNSSVYEQQH